MNWIGGARNRVKFRDERKIQKEFFERKRFNAGTDLLRNKAPFSREAGLSQDLLALQTVGKFHSSSKPGHHNQQSIRSIDLESKKFRSCTQKSIQDVDLGPQSPCPTPSKLLLMEAKHSHSNSHLTGQESYKHVGKQRKDISCNSTDNFEHNSSSDPQTENEIEGTLSSSETFSFTKPVIERHIETNSMVPSQAPTSAQVPSRTNSKSRRQMTGKHPTDSKHKNMFISEDFQTTPLINYTRKHSKLPKRNDQARTTCSQSAFPLSTSTPLSNTLKKTELPVKRNFDRFINSEISPIHKLSGQIPVFRSSPRLSYSTDHVAQTKPLDKTSERNISEHQSESLIGDHQNTCTFENLRQLKLSERKTGSLESSDLKKDLTCKEDLSNTEDLLDSEHGNHSSSSKTKSTSLPLSLRCSPVFHYSRKISQSSSCSLNESDTGLESSESKSPFRYNTSLNIQKLLAVEEVEDFQYQPIKRRRLSSDSPLVKPVDMYKNGDKERHGISINPNQSQNERRELDEIEHQLLSSPMMKLPADICIDRTPICVLLEENFTCGNVGGPEQEESNDEEHVVPKSFGTRSNDQTDTEPDLISTPATTDAKDSHKHPDSHVAVQKESGDIDEVLYEMTELEKQDNYLDEDLEVVTKQPERIENIETLPDSEVERYIESEELYWERLLPDEMAEGKTGEDKKVADADGLLNDVDLRKKDKSRTSQIDCAVDKIENETRTFQDRSHQDRPEDSALHNSMHSPNVNKANKSLTSENNFTNRQKYMETLDHRTSCIMSENNATLRETTTEKYLGKLTETETVETNEAKKSLSTVNVGTSISPLFSLPGLKTVGTSPVMFSKPQKTVGTSPIIFSKSQKIVATSQNIFSDSSKTVATSPIIFSDSSKTVATSPVIFSQSQEAANTSCYQKEASTSPLCMSQLQKTIATSPLLISQSQITVATSPIILSPRATSTACVYCNRPSKADNAGQTVWKSVQRLRKLASESFLYTWTSNISDPAELKCKERAELFKKET